MTNNKPDWKDVPNWVTYMAQDQNGKWWGYNNEPHDGEKRWDCDTDNYRLIKIRFTGVYQSWRKTLEERPND